MNLDLKKLHELAKPRSSAAIERAKMRMESYGWRKMSQDVALAIMHHLRVNGMTQKDFANKMGVSAPYVAKLMKGTENLTLETINKIEGVLGVEIVHVNRPYETIITAPFSKIPESNVTARSHRFSGNTVCSQYANVFTSVNYAV